MVLDNVRLWDDRPLLTTYAQMQSLRLYYTFTSVGIDRYQIGGHQQQVMLSARELDITRLASEARTWVNDHLAVHPRLRARDDAGEPDLGRGAARLYIKDIPPQSPRPSRSPGPSCTTACSANQYVIVNTRTKELDYPQGDQNVYASYGGTGGVPLAAPLAGWRSGAVRRSQWRSARTSRPRAG